MEKRRIKVVPGTKAPDRYYNGKPYSLAYCFHRKSDANDEAKIWREQGDLARVIKCPKGVDCDEKWCLYTHDSRLWEHHRWVYNKK